MAVAQKLRCRVEQIKDHGDHVYTVELRPERPAPRFRPGQFLHLALDEYDPSGFWPESRVFSIANSPLERDRLRISYSVRGRFTARMERELAGHRWVWVKLPYGDFVIDAGRDVVMFAGGTGITAFTAFLAHLDSAYPRGVFLVYGARNRRLLIYRDLVCRCLEKAPQVQARFFLEEGIMAGEGGTLHRARLRGCRPFGPARACGSHRSRCHLARDPPAARRELLHFRTSADGERDCPRSASARGCR